MTRHVQDMVSTHIGHMQLTISTLRDKFVSESLDDFSFEEARQSCTLIGKPFEDLKSEYKQEKYLIKKGALILPGNKVLGYQFKSKLNKSGRMVQIRQKVNFQYILLSDLIKVYLQQPGMMKAILSYKKSPDIIATLTIACHQSLHVTLLLTSFLSFVEYCQQ